MNPPPQPSSQQTRDNTLLFQTFEWHTPSTPPPPNGTHSPTSHYAHLTRLLPTLAALGITTLWLPPGCKANNPQGNGYDCYDLWDLGEFDQKWARSTKWGSREELDDLLHTAKREGVECIWDAVLNHKTAGDYTEETWAVEVDGEDRRVETTTPKKIEAWLRYDFPAREREGMRYSGMKWRAEHFNGTDWDQRCQRNAIFKLIDDPATYPKPEGVMAQGGRNGMNRLARFLVGSAPPRRPGKGWAEDVDDLHGNFDYLMFSNVDYMHPEVRRDVLDWGRWMVEDVGLDGFRLDAVQHFSYAFTKEWIAHVREASGRKRQGKTPLIVGEIWTGEVERITKWLDVVGQDTLAYDSPLLYNLSRISEDVRRKSKNADLRTILRGSLLNIRPSASVTLVANHDTQPGQASYTPMMASLKPLWYSFILLRNQGVPCVFYGDLYGTQGPHAERPACVIPDGRGGQRSLLADLMLLRRLCAYGEQKDYLDSTACIGWTRGGTHDRPGCAIVLSIAPSDKGSTKKMVIGRPGEVFLDILANEGQRAEVVIDDKGVGMFPCRSMSVSVFVNKSCSEVERFPAPFSI